MSSHRFYLGLDNARLLIPSFTTLISYRVNCATINSRGGAIGSVTCSRQSDRVLYRERPSKCQNSNIIDTYFTTSNRRQRAVRVCVRCFLVYTNIWRRDSCATRHACTCACHDACYACVYACTSVLRARTTRATRSSTGNVMFAVEWSVRARGTPGISVCREYMTVRISPRPFVALTISLIVYAAEYASAPPVQC